MKEVFRDLLTYKENKNLYSLNERQEILDSLENKLVDTKFDYEPI